MKKRRGCCLLLFKAMNTATVSASVALKQPEIRSLSLQMPGIKAAIPADPRGSVEAS